MKRLEFLTDSRFLCLISLCRLDDHDHKEGRETSEEGTTTRRGNDRTRKTRKRGGQTDERSGQSAEFDQEAGAGLGQEGQDASGERGRVERDEKNPRANLQPVQEDSREIIFIHFYFLVISQHLSR